MTNLVPPTKTQLLASACSMAFFMGCGFLSPVSAFLAYILTLVMYSIINSFESE